MSEQEKSQWYVIHTYSGYENKVRANLEKIVENRGLSHLIEDIKIPVETVVEVNDNKSKEVERKIFPSYVLVKMIMSDESWHVVRNVRGVTSFVGPGSKPIPLSDGEVEALGVETRVIDIRYSVGDSVQLINDPFKGFIGVVEEISPDKKKVRVIASMFGRETPIELDSDAVRPLD
ncbi:MAG: transcription termination/antitermination protein NusG [Eubacteriales bacterium]|jgi:transcriptional antiterminator NusG